MKHVSTAAGIAYLVCLQGCFFYQQPKQSFYSLSVSRGPSSSAVAKDVSLSITALQIPPDYENQNFIYRFANDRLESDYYNLFLSAPGANITEQLKSWLRKSDRFKSVAGLNQSTNADYVLSGSVDLLHGDFSDAKSPFAVLSMRVYLLNASSGVRKTIGQYERRVPLTNRTPDALITAWEKALASIFGEMEKGLLSQIP